MNQVILSGRLTRDVDTRYTQSNMCVARYTLAVDRKGKDKDADFIRCIAFGKSGEFAEKYLKKGTKILVNGHIATGSYKDKEGKTVNTTEVVVDGHEFCESRKKDDDSIDGFMNIAESVNAEEELPFN